MTTGQNSTGSQYNTSVEQVHASISPDGLGHLLFRAVVRDELGH